AAVPGEVDREYGQAVGRQHLRERAPRVEVSSRLVNQKNAVVAGAVQLPAEEAAGGTRDLDRLDHPRTRSRGPTRSRRPSPSALSPRTINASAAAGITSTQESVDQ